MDTPRQAAEPRTTERNLSEPLTNAAQLTQPRLGFSTDPATHRLHRDIQLACGDIPGNPLPAQRVGQPNGEIREGLRRRSQRRELLDNGRAQATADHVDHVDLDVAGVLPAADLHRAGRAGRREQAWNTVLVTVPLSASASATSTRHRRRKSRTSGTEEGRARKTFVVTTLLGTDPSDHSIGPPSPSPWSFLSHQLVTVGGCRGQYRPSVR